MARINVEFARRSLVGESLTDDEKGLIMGQIDRFVTFKSATLQELFKDNEQSILGAASVAKAYWGMAFGGMLAADTQIGFTPIRPGHLLRTTATTETASNTWNVTFASGNAHWIGYGASNATAIHMDKELLVLILGLMFTQGNQPVVEEIIPTIGETNYLPQVIRLAWAGDNENRIRVAQIHPLIIEQKQTALIDVNAIAAGTNELVVLGLTFGVGRTLRASSYSSIAT